MFSFTRFFKTSRNFSRAEFTTPRPGVRGRPIVRILLVSMILACTFGVSYLSKALLPFEQHPSLRLPEHPLYLGEGDPSSMLRGTFELRNVGGQPLTFDIASSCSCSLLTPRRGVIAPYERVPIEVGIQLDGRAGHEKNARLIIQTNDPNRAQATYMVSATCPLPFHVFPDALDFGNVPEGEGTGAQLRIRHFQSGAVPLLKDASLSVDSTAFIATWSNQSLEDGLVADVQLASDAPRGMHHANVTIAVESRPAVPVSVSARVVGPVLVAPATIFLQAGSKGEPAREAHFLVWKADGTPLGRLEATRCPEGVSVKQAGSVTKNRLRFSVHLVEGADLNHVAGEVQMTFENVSVPASVRITASPARNSMLEPD